MPPQECHRRQGGMALGKRGDELQSPSQCLLQVPFRRTRRSTGELMAVWHTFADHHDRDNGMIITQQGALKSPRVITVILSVIVTGSSSRKGVTRTFYKSEMGTSLLLSLNPSLRAERLSDK